jgi:uncharacterized protein YjiS (DUF1127 family)
MPARASGKRFVLRWDWLEACLRNHRGRRLIAEMDARTLADIGLDRALAEIEKPFWRD